MNIRNLSAGALVAFGIGILSTTPCLGAETLTYTGNYFTSIGNNVYSTSDRITATIVLSSPLGRNFDGLVVPSSFMLSDGVNSYSNSPGTLSDFDFVTNGSGQITSWSMDARIDGFYYFAQSMDMAGDVEDIGEFGVTEDREYGLNMNDPGSWTTGGAPEPAEWAILLMGIAVLGGTLRLRRALHLHTIAAAP
jgi:hypothetical protein